MNLPHSSLQNHSLSRDDNTAVVIAHFHPAGRVARHLIDFVIYVKSHVTPHIVLVSTGLSDDGKELLEKHCKVILRENFGYDFWSYKVGIDALSSAKPWKRLLIINSSIVIANPALLALSIFGRPVGRGIIGLTISREFAIHVQSYCVIFEGEDFINSNAMRNWWSAMEPISDREQVIQKYEIGMSQYFMKSGYSPQSLYKPTQGKKALAIMRAIVQSEVVFNIPEEQNEVMIRLNRSDHLNPTHFMWDFVFKKFGVIKIDFLRQSIFSGQLLSLIKRSPAWAGTSVQSLINDALI